MLLLATVLLIGTLTALAALLRRWVWRGLCPLCAGVSLTWLLLLAAAARGWPVDLRLPALLMGASVLGLASALERRVPQASARTALVWKAVFLATGVATAYALLLPHWAGLGLGLAGLSLLSGGWLWQARPTVPRQHGRQNDLLADLEHCC